MNRTNLSKHTVNRPVWDDIRKHMQQVIKILKSKMK
jgi:hypothetical protein